MQIRREIKGSVHFVGIGGVGMSGLAQMYRWAGFEVSGSDRALNNPENIELFAKLRKQGIRIHLQDGSFIKEGNPSLMVYSTAIESDNPDFIAGKDIEKIHRAKALSQIVVFMKDKVSIAISGSCGKTTATAWAGEALYNLGLDPIVLNGGMINSFCDETYTGNFHPGKGKYFIYEADESDKSLVAFSPDYSVLLNIGTDHYSKEELVEVFEKFLKNTKKGAVIESELFEMLSKESYSHLQVKIVSCNVNREKIEFHLPQPGEHNVANALCVIALINLIIPDIDLQKVISAVESFNGVYRRFEKKGFTSNGAQVIDDYAHNVEKIVSCIKTAQEISSGRVFAVFQPHGYGPFKFMREPLFPELEKCLRTDDKFILMPVYYAGGTSSFTPKSEEVHAEYDSKSIIKDRYLFFENRVSAGKFLQDNTSSGDTIIIMGARDSSLALWADELTKS
jgi:UDP-N-acetylmuramate--alanine ligase